MGSYNVACSISNLSINAGDPVVFIPLRQSRFGAKLGDGNFSLIYCHAIYSPATLPIFGKYDWYGGIEDIERNANVEFLEAKFKDSIQSICSLESTPDAITAGMFVLREIYDELSTKPIGEFGKKKAFDVPTIDQILGEIQEWQRKMVKEKEDAKRFKEILGREEEERDFSHLLYAAMYYRNYDFLCKLYEREVEEGRLHQEFAEFAMFIHGMFSVNTFFFPAMNGYQYGNDYMSRKLYMKALEISRRRIKRRKEDND